ncbi:MAG: transposase [Paludibaculum sp.]
MRRLLPVQGVDERLEPRAGQAGGAGDPPQAHPLPSSRWTNSFPSSDTGPPFFGSTNRRPHPRQRNVGVPAEFGPFRTTGPTAHRGQVGISAVVPDVRWSSRRATASGVGIATDAANVSETALGPAALATLGVTGAADPIPVLADRAYDADGLREDLASEGFVLLARHRSNCTKPATNDGRRLKRRWEVERTFAWLHSSAGW